ASLTHVPYRGAAPALTDVVAGRVQAIVLGVNSLIPHIQSGPIKPLATASNKHFSYLSGVPSAAEAGVPDWNLSVWFGLFGPRGTSHDIIDKLNGYVQKLADNPTVKGRMEKSYLDLMAMSSKQFSDFVRSEAEKWERIVQDSGIPPQ